MTEAHVFMVGALFGAALVLLALAAVGWMLGVFDRPGRSPSEERLLIAVRRLLLDPTHHDAATYVGDHLDRLRELVARADREDLQEMGE